MEIKILASSSAGNSALISDGETSILIDCGLVWKKLQQKLKFKTSQIDFVLCTHQHQDHCRAAKDIIKNGIPLFLSRETAKAIGVNGHNVNIFESQKQFKVGSFDVLAFPVKHDVENHGFLIKSDRTGEKLLWITDCPYCEYRFKDLDYICLEANYQSEILQQNIEDGLCGPGLKERLLQTHMSLDQAIGFLRANDLKAIRSISLLHLSSRNANAEQMKDTIVKEFGKPVFVCGMADHVLEFGNGGVKVN